MKKLFLILLTMFTLSSCGLHTVADDTRNDPIPTDQSDDDADDDSSEDADTGADTDDATSTEHKVYAVEDLVTYYNGAATEEEQIVYDEEHQYWIYTSEIHTEDSDKETMQHTVHHYLDYVPLYRIVEDGYMFRYREHYDEDENSYVYVAVSSDWFAAMTIESRWASSELTTMVIAYDGRSGLYM